MLRTLLAVFIALSLSISLGAAAAAPKAKSDALVTTDHFVPHVSTVPANAGQLVGLYVRQKVLKSRHKGGMAGRVVLFVHGATVPSVPDFDLDYKTYNWMAYLARAATLLRFPERDKGRSRCCYLRPDLTADLGEKTWQTKASQANI